MTKRKILAIIIAISMCSVMSACSSEETPKVEKNDSGIEAFVVLGEARIGKDLWQKIMYDPETNVMYSYFDGTYGGGIVVMYNADGTPRLYSSENKTD